MSQRKHIVKRQQLKPLWRCPKCGARLVTKNMWHSCGRYTLEELFARSEPHVFTLFEKFAGMVRACGPVTMVPQKTRVVFMVRVRFAAVYPRRTYILVGLGLSRTLDSARIKKREEYASHFIGHMMEIHSHEELDRELHGWLRESFAVGQQKFLLR